MEIRVLGCSGARFPGYGASSFMLDGNLLIDAGTVTSVLSLEEQVALKHVLVTHAHLDHVQDIMFLADNLLLQKDHPLKVFGTSGVIAALKTHLFNNVIWPDFSMLPSPEYPVIVFKVIEKDAPFMIDDYRITAVSVDHTVETVAYLVEREDKRIIFAGDTGPTEKMWRIANDLDELAAIFIETSFPNSMTEVANAAGHLTPKSLLSELGKLDDNSVSIYLYHLKPQYRQEIERETGLLGNKKISILSDGDRIVV